MIENSKLSLTGLHQLIILPSKMNFIARRQEGTSEWLFESDEFQQWENNKSCTLFCPGIPGSGKTVMVSIVVDYLFKRFRNDPGIGIAFLYCNFRQRQEQRLIDLFLTLLKQFSQRHPLLPECNLVLTLGVSFGGAPSPAKVTSRWPRNRIQLIPTLGLAAPA